MGTLRARQWLGPISLLAEGPTLRCWDAVNTEPALSVPPWELPGMQLATWTKVMPPPWGQSASSVWVREGKERPVFFAPNPNSSGTPSKLQSFTPRGHSTPFSRCSAAQLPPLPHPASFHSFPQVLIPRAPPTPIPPPHPTLQEHPAMQSSSQRLFPRVCNKRPPSCRSLGAGAQGRSRGRAGGLGTGG